MKFFVDTADTAAIRQLVATGLVDGVTTNPSLILKSGRDIREAIQEICAITPGPVSAEVVATTAEAMLREGRSLAALAPNVVVKLPLTEDGLRACRAFAQEGVKTNVTLCFSATQGLLAAKAGASYISPFIGRIDDTGAEGMELIRDLRMIYDNYGYETEILAASIRGPLHVRDCALAGADVATVPPDVLRALARHPLTDKGLEAFLADWAKTGQTIL